MDELIQRLEGYGVTYERLKSALDSKDNWGSMVHSFEYITVLSTVETLWRKDRREAV